MTDFQKVLKSIENTCVKNNISYILIGGFANILHGSVRTTRDIDVVVFVKYDEMERVVTAFKKEFCGRVENQLQFLKKYFVLPLTHFSTKIEVDLSLGFSEFEKNALARSKKIKFQDVEINVCSVEDLILFKLVAARPRDLLDVQELMYRYRGKLDVKYLKSIAEAFREIERSDVPELLIKYLS